jgi:hypothetical protein
MRTSTFSLGHKDALVDACAHVPDFGRLSLDSLVHVDIADSVVASIDAKVGSRLLDTYFQDLSPIPFLAFHMKILNLLISLTGASLVQEQEETRLKKLAGEARTRLDNVVS